VLDQFVPELLQMLPMNDTVFIAKLIIAGLLPGNLKTTMKLLPTAADKADYFLDEVIFPDLDVGARKLNCLLKIMKETEDPYLITVASKIESSLTSFTPESGSSTSAPGKIRCYSVTILVEKGNCSMYHVQFSCISFYREINKKGPFLFNANVS